jgi:hemolysin III
MLKNKSLQTPLLRGYIHQEAFFVALGACLLLIFKSSSPMAQLASLIYSMGLLILLGISAFYHRHDWPPKARAVLRRLDHSAIFLLIAGTFTPICLLALSPQAGHRLLLIIWIVALFGILQSIFWTRAPRLLNALFYVVTGWIALPYFYELKSALGIQNLLLLVLGGITYSVGALFYAVKKPNLSPNIFGYHELFHVFTIVGATLHFIVIYQLIV